MASLRAIYLDDTSPEVVYSGEWSDDTDPYTTGSGFVWGGSQHRTVGNASLTFEYSGMFLVIQGRVARIVPEDTSVPATSSWTCEIDGEVVPSRVPEIAGDFNGFSMCILSSPSEGRHTFQLHATASESLPIWIDRLTILPLANATYSGYTAELDPQDSAIQYVNGRWDTTHASNGLVLFMHTAQIGTSLRVDFNGTRVAWLTNHRVNPNQTYVPSRGEYKIDDLPPVAFEIPGRSPETYDPLQQVLFETESLAYGPHRLSVTYLGDSAPLVLAQLWITDGDLFSPTTNHLADIPRLSSDSSESQKASSNPGAIVGGVLGGIGALMLLALAWYLLVFKKRKAGIVGAVIPNRAHEKVAQPQPLMAEAFEWNPSQLMLPAPGGSVAGPSSSYSNSIYGDQSGDSALSEKARLRTQIERQTEGLQPQQIIHQHQDSVVRLHRDANVANVPPTYTRD
ncbi:hypothetical protein FA15DRAFT_744491 [Coprinopsis marcescibilis]|uniref:Uncharacterized protein n=1 Tax=Coprinopsis marcescibilis TaxID=230819 RepID=A0A5C3L7D8_COPMA|nr:hypothetical protein FA15DRAFT_744491 [Coprinopsis marcescibilis]